MFIQAPNVPRSYYERLNAFNMQKLDAAIDKIALDPKHYSDLNLEASKKIYEDLRAIAMTPPPSLPVPEVHPEPKQRANGTGYGGWKYSREGMRSRAEAAIEGLRAAMNDTGCDVVVVHGTSGTSLVGAVLLLWPEDDTPPKFVMLRKDMESSHGSQIETGEGFEFDEYLVLDDFICSGDTMSRIKRKLNRATMRGIVVHDRSGGMGQAPGGLWYGVRVY